jgi:transposase
LIGEMAGVQGTSRSLLQTFCASGLCFPIGLGAIQKVIDRVTGAIQPYYEAIARLARHAPVGYIDETPWWCQGTLQWLWVLTSPEAAFYRIDTRRSKAAFLALIDDWDGVLVSDGYSVYHTWVSTRQTCLAHLIRRARGFVPQQRPGHRRMRHPRLGGTPTPVSYGPFPTHRWTAACVGCPAV